MTFLDSVKTQYTERMLPALPAPLRNIIEGGSRKQLLGQISHRLLLCDNQLVHIETGRTQQLAESEESYSAHELAQAAQRLIGSAVEGGVILYLPPSEFVSTSFDMPGVSKENLISALQLQADNLFPSLDVPLSLTLGSHQLGSDLNNVALWHSEQRTDDLFDSFSSVNLFLVAVAPRVLIDCSLPAIVDVDLKGGTLVQLTDGTMSDWLHINKLDMNDEALNQQWTTQLQRVGAQAKTVDSPASFNQFLNSEISLDYAFIPNGAMQARKRVEKGRNLMFAAAAVVFLMMVASVPFAMQSLEFRGLATNLAAQREQSVQAREDQGVVVNFENEWGPITDFPIQDVEEAMFTLQNILLPDQLASLELSEGLIKIQGTSTEPQAILQRLEQDPMFTEVVFSRATNNSRYYIDLRLSTVNFEGYMVRYFPDD